MWFCGRLTIWEKFPKFANDFQGVAAQDISRESGRNAMSESGKVSAPGRRAPLVAIAGRRSGAARRTQRGMPRAAGPARRRERCHAPTAAAVVDAARRSGRRCRRRPCAGCPPRPSACSMPGSRRRRAGSSCARAASTNQPQRVEPPISSRPRRARSRVACWSTAGTSRAAGRVRPAWSSARPCAGVESLAACSLVGARGRGRSQRRSAAAALGEPDQLLARAAARRVSGRRPATARTTARRCSAPCRGNTRGACSLTTSARAARRRNARAVRSHRTFAGGARAFNITRGAT